MTVRPIARHPYHTGIRLNAGSNVSFRDLPLTFAKSAKVKYHATFDSLNVTVTTQTHDSCGVVSVETTVG